MKKLVIIAIITGAMLSSCSTKDSVNPLLTEWDTQFGIPPFEDIKLEHYMPAYLEGMKQHKAQIQEIINNPQEPNFENTIVAYDNSGDILRKVAPVFSSLNSVNSSPEVLALAKELSPLTSKHYNEISLNDSLFLRVKSVYDKIETLNLNPEQTRLLTEMYKGFVRNGAELAPDKKEELKEINSKISSLQLSFGQNLLAETANYKLVIDNEEDLAGLSESLINAAKVTDENSDYAGKWVFGLDNPSVMPFLQQSDKRELRKEILDAYLNRCNNDNEFDNKEVIKELITLRLKRANLLGFDNFADYQLETRMAKKTDAVYSLLNQLWTPALKSAKQELADMTLIAKAHNKDISKLEAYDWRYYFEKAMASKFNLSDNELRPYFKLENVREGIFYVANQLYGVTFTQLEGTPLPHPEAIAFECKEADGTHLGVLFMDMFARPGAKRGGAWCGRFRTQVYSNGQRISPLVTVVGNFTRPSGDKPALLSLDETETYFHEFGHALESLFKDVTYYGVGGMTRDFVELPSQIMEHWAFEPQVLKVYAKHYETGEVIPQELVDKIEKAGKYGQGFATTEYLAASILDMDFHILNSIPKNIDILKFEQESMSKLGLISQIPPRYRSTYFNHTFGGGYTAGYYSYIWAEVLDSDAYQAFVETGDIFNKEVATKFRKEILSRGGQDEAMTLYVNFRGKEPGIDALLKNRGLN
ncbi:MAG: M3 family metallopeptidase [Bacteroidales bacterium]|nr:M3 family metallopeptidase [Bacteroidales bacterium]